MSRIVSTTGQEFPGGASRIAIPVCGRCFFTARMSGGEMAWPMRSRPWTNSTAPAAPRSTSPIARGTSRMAASGHTRLHPPHPWQRSGKVNTALPRHTMALYWQNSPQRPQCVHFASLTSGTGIVTVSRLVISGFRKMCPLGASTSQSR